MSRKEELKKWRKSKSGLISNIYSSQKQSSKKRLHNPPTYSKEWLENWLLINPEFHRLYDIWVISGYDKMLKPSVDRIDDNIGYTEYNIQLMTWRENKEKYYNNIRKNISTNKGLFNKGHKSVRQFDLDNNFIAEYISLHDAERQTGILSQNISKVCKGKRKSTGGYLWRY